MKIGILTFHYSVNLGSVLQAYCVYRLLKEQLPSAEVEIIDLTPFNREKAELRSILKKALRFNFEGLYKARSFRRFLETSTKFSPRCYAQGLSSQIRFIEKQQYDAIFVGSDTVWMHSPKLGSILPNIYFLPGLPNTRKVAIAASCDPLLDEEEFKSFAPTVVESLAPFEAITVRDFVTRDLLNSIGITSTMICDPTLLYDFAKQLGIEDVKGRPTDIRHALVVIANKEVRNFVVKYLQTEKKIEVAQISPFGPGKDHVTQDLTSMRRFDLVVTDRFHRSIFAMKLSSALVINIEIAGKYPQPKSKGRDLFSQLDMPQYVLRYCSENTEVFRLSMDDALNQWNSNRLDAREDALRRLIEQGQKTLSKVLVNFN